MLYAKLSIGAWTLGILCIIALVTWLLMEKNVIQPLRNSSRYIKEIANGNLAAVPSRCN
ncbi:MAG: hypothetical protein P4L69_12080 [Desulfosporosinus sp.]|nr:hypothetical protein [Desulfosporosinus sp.]